MLPPHILSRLLSVKCRCSLKVPDLLCGDAEHQKSAQNGPHRKKSQEEGVHAAAHITGPPKFGAPLRSCSQDLRKLHSLGRFWVLQRHNFPSQHQELHDPGKCQAFHLELISCPTSVFRLPKHLSASVCAAIFRLHVSLLTLPEPFSQLNSSHMAKSAKTAFPCPHSPSNCKLQRARCKAWPVESRTLSKCGKSPLGMSVSIVKPQR